MPEIKVPIETLRQRKLFVATPMYGGQCYGTYTRSIANLSALCAHHGIQVRFYFMFNESLITRARNYCVDEFLRSGDTHLMFIDSDITFEAQDVLAMLALQSENPDNDDYDVLAGPYPKKNISWEKIKQAVEKGKANENPQDLERYVGDYVFNPAPGTDRIQLDQPAEILEAGTGFMMIRRATLEKFEETYPLQRYKPDHARTEHFDGSREITAFFDTPIDNKYANLSDEMNHFLQENPNVTGEELAEFLNDRNAGRDYSMRYLSEDYMFCQWVRRMGLKVWFCPWIKLAHTGTYMFAGSLADIASVGANPTADVGQLRKHRESDKQKGTKRRGA